MSKRSVLLVAFVAGSLLLTACSSGSPGSATDNSGAQGSVVSIENFAFGPDVVDLSVGDTVTWTNDESSTTHTTTSNNGLWDSGRIGPGDTFEHTFDEPGTFSYLCTIHPSMTATVTVSDKD